MQPSFSSRFCSNLINDSDFKNSSERNIHWLFALLFCLSACTETVPSDQGVRVASRGIISAAISEDATLSFIGSFNDGGSLWRMTDHERLFNWNHTKEEPSVVRSAVFSEDGQFAATSNDQIIALWNTSTGQSVRFWNSPSRITSLDMAKQYILIGQNNNTALVFDIINGGMIGSLKHKDIVSSVSMDDKAKFALTGSHDGRARYWSLDDGEEIHNWPHQTPVELVQLSQDGQYALTAAYQGPVSLWNTLSGDKITELYKKNPGIVSARFDPLAHQLLLGTSREKVILWNVAEISETRRWQLPYEGPWHRSAIIALSFLPLSHLQQDAKPKYRVIASDGFSYLLD
jgi:WD40 repeat protein